MNQAPVPMGYVMPGLPALRVTDRDRDAAIAVLQSSYTIGRLTRAEHDARVGQALAAATYPELDVLTADLPERPVYPDAPVPVLPPSQRHVNGFAVAALICGAAQPVTGMLSTIPAIAFGHVAKAQIRRTGEDGSAMATWGLVLGWTGLGVIALIVLGIVLLAVLTVR
jgi:hypothetical protein